MKRVWRYLGIGGVGIAGILAASVIAHAVIARNNTHVYSLNVGSFHNIPPAPWRDYRTSWFFGDGYGLYEYVEHQDAKGNVILLNQLGWYSGVALPSELAVKSPTYTEVYFGPRSLKLRAPFWLVAGALVVLAIGFINLAVAAVRWVCEADGDKTLEAPAKP